MAGFALECDVPEMLKSDKIMKGSIIGKSTRNCPRKYDLKEPWLFPWVACRLQENMGFRMAVFSWGRVSSGKTLLKGNLFSYNTVSFIILFFWPKSFIINSPPTWRQNSFREKSFQTIFFFQVFQVFNSGQLEKQIVWLFLLKIFRIVRKYQDRNSS